jgi:glycosyltransferase involved in cell wall biosynthesis
MRFIYYLLRFIFEALSLPVLTVVALLARHAGKEIDVGLGPYPLINNIFHKRALQLGGYKAETFVSQVWHITSDFDVRFDRHWLSSTRLTRLLALNLYLFVWTAFRYRALIIYFDGGPMGLGTAFLWRLEPHLYRLAGVRTIVLPYGSDVQVMSRSPNLLFKHAMSVDYPSHRKRHRHIQGMLDVWTAYADHIVSGCEWVDYMHHWDTLMISHFSIELPPLGPISTVSDSGRIRLLHAPNHREIKGTRHLEQVVADLNAEGYDIELIIVERVSNDEVRRMIQACDLVVDQLVIGWYAMFAIEAMASGKPVICHLRADLEELYVGAGLLEGFNEIPIIRADVHSLKQVLRRLYSDRSKLRSAGERGRKYVERHHSTASVSRVFGNILRPLIGARATAEADPN